MSNCFSGGLRAAFFLALLTGAGTLSAGSPGNAVAVLIGGDSISGDQTTDALDASIPSAFSYQRLVSGAATATAYLNWHLFCAETPRTPSQVSLLPRYQLPASIGNDVWQFPDVYLHAFSYKGSGFLNAGAPALHIGEATSPGLQQMRCLSAVPGSSLEPWYAHSGLFSNGYGDYIGASNAALNMLPPQDPPAGPHQNVKVVAQTFTGFPGMAVSVVRVEMQFDPSVPANTDWTLVDAYNTSALSSSIDANWCLLKTSWVEGTTPPAALCDDSSIIFPGQSKETGPFVRRSIGFQVVAPGPYYVLVSRTAIGIATPGTPKQGFAALRTGGGMAHVAEEVQDWFSADSVWYNY